MPMYLPLGQTHVVEVMIGRGAAFVSSSTYSESQSSFVLLKGVMGSDSNDNYNDDNDHFRNL